MASLTRRGSGLLVLAMIGCGGGAARPVPPAATPPPAPRPTVAVSAITAPPLLELEARGCWAMCPVYRLVIHRDGAVGWHGELFVKVLGPARGQLDPATLAAIEQRLVDPVSGFSTLAPAYPARGDGHGERLALTYHGPSGPVRVLHDLRDPSAPLALIVLEHDVRDAVPLLGWAGTRDEVRPLAEAQLAQYRAAHPAPTIGAPAASSSR